MGLMRNTERIERRLKLHDLRIMMAVVESGSMNKAAQMLATSQPAISRAIADLEHSLGVRLLDRGPQGIEPTPYGRVLINRSVAAFDELRAGLDDLQSLASPQTGEVRVAAAVALAGGFVAAVIHRMSRHYLGIKCHLMVDDPSLVLRRLENREVDLAIAFLLTPVPDNRVDAQILYYDPLFVVASSKNPWSRRRKVSLSDLVNEPWTLPPPDSEFGMAYMKIFRTAGLGWPQVMVVGTSGIARTALVARSRFLTITVQSAFRFVYAGIKPLPIDLGEARPVGLFTLKNRTLTAAAQLFIKTAAEVAKPLAARQRLTRKRGS